MEDNKPTETTDSWPWGKILKHVIFPKPKDAPKAGKKEISARVGVALIFAALIIPRFFDGKTPVCDDDRVIETLKNLGSEIVATGASPELIKEAKINEASRFTIANIRTIGHNKDTDSYSCGASIRFVFEKKESEILFKQDPLDEKSLHSMMLHYGTLFYTKTMNSARLAATLLQANNARMNSLVTQNGDSTFIEISQQYTIEKITDDGKKDFLVNIDLRKSQPAVDAVQHWSSFVSAYRMATSNAPLLSKHDYSQQDIEFKSQAQRNKEREESVRQMPDAPAAEAPSAN
jgi:hypothetical protein